MRDIPEPPGIATMAATAFGQVEHDAGYRSTMPMPSADDECHHRPDVGSPAPKLTTALADRRWP
jgi:hypothetical protein